MKNRENYRKERIDRCIKARSDDIYALSSYKEMWYLIFPRVVPIIGIAILAYFLPLYWKKVVITTCIVAMLAVSWDFLSSCGLLSLGQALFFGIGSYTAGCLNHYFHVPIYLTIPIATICGGFISTILLLPVIRLRGIYFAMVTLILPLMLARGIEATHIFGGNEGITGLSPFPNVWVELTFIIAGMWAALFALRRFISSDYGLIFVSIRDNDRATMASGINIYSFKAQALFIGSSICAFCGAFMTHSYMFTGIPVFTMEFSILPIAASAIGGIGTLAGPLLGAFILVPLSEILREFGTLRVVFYGLVLVVCVVALPEGIFHYLSRKYNEMERWVRLE
ncbi:MAG: branched-chain amino acid ABC transporter permease [Proteobacteria bacterium]|jgi:branched-chain amino acid transport system permease protein|nr:branched-chain amino acid ABC transporter permease [Pseudomonadota bacterium]